MGGKKFGRNFALGEFDTFLLVAQGSTQLWAERTSRLDSAGRIGLETTLTDYLIVVVGYGTEGGK